MALRKIFQQNIARRRKELGLTMAQVAERMGVSQPCYAQYELGTRTPGLDVIEKISSALETNAISLLIAMEPAAA